MMDAAPREEDLTKYWRRCLTRVTLKKEAPHQKSRHPEGRREIQWRKKKIMANRQTQIEQRHRLSPNRCPTNNGELVPEYPSENYMRIR